MAQTLAILILVACSFFLGRMDGRSREAGRWAPRPIVLTGEYILITNSMVVVGTNGISFPVSTRTNLSWYFSDCVIIHGPSVTPNLKDLDYGVEYADFDHQLDHWKGLELQKYADLRSEKLKRSR